MKFKYRTIVRNLSNKVYYDQSFQRRISWSQKDKDSFIQAATRDWALQPITLAHVEKCLEYAREQKDTLSVEYFHRLLSGGFKYVSIDGQNRTKFIIDFFNNDVSISGKLKDADGNYDDFKNVYLKTLQAHSPRTFDNIKDLILYSNIYEESSRHDLAELFRNINSGNPLSPHGHRQSLLTPVADWVRSISQRHQKMLLRIVDSKKLKDMIDDELMAKLVMILMKDYINSSIAWNLSRSDMDSWYKMGVGFYSFDDPNCPYLKEEVERAENIIDILSGLINNQTIYSNSQRVPRRFVIAALHLAEYVYDNNFMISKYETAASKLSDIDEKLFSDSDTEYSSARTEKIKNGIDPKTVTKYNYYSHWTAVPHQSDNRQKRKIVLLKSILNNHDSLTIRHKPNEIEMAA